MSVSFFLSLFCFTCRWSVSFHSHWNFLPSGLLWFLLYVPKPCLTLTFSSFGPQPTSWEVFHTPGGCHGLSWSPGHHRSVTLASHWRWNPVKTTSLEFQTKRGRSESSKTLSLNLHPSSLPRQKLPPYQQSKEKFVVTVVMNGCTLHSAL